MKKVKRRSKKKTETAIVTESGRIKRKKEKILIVDVLGTSYDLRIPVDTSDLDNAKADGLCDDIGKDIQIRDLRDTEGMSKKNAILEMKHNIRHELIHAFIHECGLAQNNSVEVSPWVDEGVVDWISLQYDKLGDLFKQGYQIISMLE